MKKLLFIFFLCVGISYGQDLQQLRIEYPKANKNEEITNVLFDQLADITEKESSTKLAYKGAISTLKAKFSKAVKNKKEHFKQGVLLLEDAITSEPKNIEIRCLRLGVQENSPKILKYKQHIAEDKRFIIDHYSSVTNAELQNFIKGYVSLSSLFTDVEKQLF